MKNTVIPFPKRSDRTDTAKSVRSFHGIFFNANSGSIEKRPEKSTCASVSYHDAAIQEDAKSKQNDAT